MLLDKPRAHMSLGIKIVLKTLACETLGIKQVLSGNSHKNLKCDKVIVYFIQKQKVFLLMEI